MGVVQRWFLVTMNFADFQNSKFPVYRSVRGALRTPEYSYYLTEMSMPPFQI